MSGGGLAEKTCAHLAQANPNRLERCKAQEGEFEIQLGLTPMYSMLGQEAKKRLLS